jgi:hypothetical protein
MEALTFEDAKLDSRYHRMIIDDATMGQRPRTGVVPLWNKDRVTLAPGARARLADHRRRSRRVGQVRRLRGSKRSRVAQRTYHQALADNLRHFRCRRQTVPHVGHTASPRTSNTSGWLVSGCTRRRGRPGARYFAILQARQRFFMEPERQRPRRQSSVALARVATKRHMRDAMDYRWRTRTGKVASSRGRAPGFLPA